MSIISFTIHKSSLSPWHLLLLTNDCYLDVFYSCYLPWDVNLSNSTSCSVTNHPPTHHASSHCGTPKLDALLPVPGWIHQPHWHRGILVTAGRSNGKLFQMPQQLHQWVESLLSENIPINWHQIQIKLPCHNLFHLFLHSLINSNTQSTCSSLPFLLKLAWEEILLYRGIFCLWKPEEISPSCCRAGSRLLLPWPTLPTTRELALTQTVLVYFVTFKQKYVLGKAST